MNTNEKDPRSVQAETAPESPGKPKPWIKKLAQAIKAAQKAAWRTLVRNKIALAAAADVATILALIKLFG